MKQKLAIPKAECAYSDLCSSFNCLGLQIFDRKLRDLRGKGIFLTDIK